MEKKFADYVLAQDRVKFLVVFVMYKKKEFEVCLRSQQCGFIIQWKPRKKASKYSKAISKKYIKRLFGWSLKKAKKEGLDEADVLYPNCSCCLGMFDTPQLPLLLLPTRWRSSYSLRTSARVSKITV